MISNIKQKLLVMTIAMFIIITCTSSLTAHAYFYISNYDIHAELLANGDLKIKEDITYSTDELGNGVYSTFEYGISPSEDFGITRFELGSVRVNGEKFQRGYSLENGDDGAYTYEDDNFTGTVTIKVFSPFIGEKQEKVVTYEYIYEDIAVKYNDTSQLYWNFMSDTMEDEIKNLNLTLILPPGSEEHVIDIFCHGLSGVFLERKIEGTSLEKRTITLNVTDEIYRENIDIRVLFDKSALVGNHYYIREDMYDAIIKEEEGKHEIKQLFNIYKKAGIIVTPFVIVILISAIKRKKKDIAESKASREYYTQIPYDEHPAILLYAYRKDFEGLINVMFLELVRRGVYSIVKERSGNKKVEYIEYLIEGMEDVELTDFEKILVKKINEKIERDNTTGTLREDYKKVKEKLEIDKVLYKEVRKIESIIKKDYEKKYGKIKRKGFGDYILEVLMTIITYLLVALPYPIWNHYILFQSSAFDMGFQIIIGAILMIGFIKMYRSTKKTYSMVIVFILTMMAALLLCIMNLVMSGFLHSINFLAALAASLILFSIFKLTEEQRNLNNMLLGLKRYIEDASLLNERGIEHIVLWEKYLIMTSIFGSNKEIQKYLKVKILEEIENENNSRIDDNYISFANNYSTISKISYDFAETVNTSYENAVGLNEAGVSYTSSSGGIGGGGCGGRGGGRF